MTRDDVERITFLILTELSVDIRLAFNSNSSNGTVVLKFKDRVISETYFDLSAPKEWTE